MRILCIEPDQILAQTYVSALQTAGYVVDHAINGQTAIILADEACPDLVIMELQLPGINGIGFLQEFRSYSDWNAVPVILHSFTSPRNHPEMKQLVLDEYNVFDWFYKPQVSLERLLTIVNGCISEGSSKVQ